MQGKIETQKINPRGGQIRGKISKMVPQPCLYHSIDINFLALTR